MCVLKNMEYAEFRRQIGKAGLTIKKFAGLLMLNPKSVSNYASCKSVPNHLAIIGALMGELAERKIDIRTVLASIDIQGKVSCRGGKKKKGTPFKKK